MCVSPQNQGLREALAQWIVSATPLLVQLLEHAGISRFGRWVLANELRTEGTALHDLPETAVLFELARNIPELAVEDSRKQVDETVSEVLARFAIPVVDKLKTSEVGEETLNSLYKDLEDYLFGYQAIPFVMTAELWHVRFDASPIALQRNVTVRHVSDDEREQFAQSSSRAPATSPFQDGEVPGFLLEANGTLGEVTDGPPHTDSFDSFRVRQYAKGLGDRLLLALRLLGGLEAELGKVRFTWRNQLIDSQNFDFGGPCSVPIRYLFEEIPDFQLSEDDIDRLRAIWPFISRTSGKEYKTLALAISRFQSSFQRTSLIDRFIDQWIAIEALFGEGGPEATHRMCQLLAMHIGRDAEDSWAIFRNAKDAYRSRSAVVHGRQLEHGALEEQMKLVEDYLRRALLRCVQDKKKPDPGKLGKELFIRPRPASWD